MPYPDNYNRFTAPDGFNNDEDETDEEFTRRIHAWVVHALSRMLAEAEFSKDERHTDDWTDAITTAIDNDAIPDAFKDHDMRRANDPALKQAGE